MQVQSPTNKQVLERREEDGLAVSKWRQRVCCLRKVGGIERAFDISNSQRTKCRLTEERVVREGCIIVSRHGDKELVLDWGVR